jgi:hypothetical protein
VSFAMKVSIVHDEFGRITSINRPADDLRIVVLSDNRQSVLVTDVNEDQINDLIENFRIDISKRILVDKLGSYSVRSSQ